MLIFTRQTAPLLSRHRAQGFSLIEMAVVMLIMGSLLSGLLVTLTATTENKRRGVAENQLNRFEEALFGFAQAHGRLPCPATSTSDGLEDPVGGGDCASSHGLLPSATLNLYGQINDDGLLLDPWGNPYRYSVSDLDAPVSLDRAFTSASGLSELFDTPAALIAGANMIQVCEENTCLASTPLADIVPAIVFSMGENWAATNTSCSSVVNADEEENAGAVLDGAYCVTNTNNFVSRTYVQDVFDDVALWLSPHILYSRMISAGQLP